MQDSLTIFGHPASQPSRTVFWLCLIHDLPFRLGSGGAEAGTGGTNPRGEVPSILDGDFSLAEMSAIVCYLADKHGWHACYPTELQTRARIHQFLHMHHTLVRLATLRLMAPFVLQPMGYSLEGGNPLSIFQHDSLVAAFSSSNPLKDGRAIVSTIVAFLERAYFGDASPFLCQTPAASVADLACYSELAQLRMAQLFDFRGHPRTLRWLDEMAKLPHHDAIHAFNQELGDIATAPNSPERFAAATEAGIAALEQSGLLR